MRRLSQSCQNERDHRVAAVLMAIVLSVPAFLDFRCGTGRRSWSRGHSLPESGRSQADARASIAGGDSGTALAPLDDRDASNRSLPAGQESRRRIRGRTDTGTPDNAATDPVRIEVRVLHGLKNRLGEFGPAVRLSPVSEGVGGRLNRIAWRPRGEQWRRYKRPIPLHSLWKRGISTVEFYAEGRASNSSEVVRFPFRIDDVAPQLPPLRVGRFPTGGKAGTFVGSEGIFVPPFEPGAMLEYRLDQGEFAACQAGQTIRPPADGVFTITFRIRDELGNSRERTFRIKADSTAPRTTIHYE